MIGGMPMSGLTVFGSAFGFDRSKLDELVAQL